MAELGAIIIQCSSTTAQAARCKRPGTKPARLSQCSPGRYSKLAATPCITRPHAAPNSRCEQNLCMESRIRPVTLSEDCTGLHSGRSDLQYMRQALDCFLLKIWAQSWKAVTHNATKISHESLQTFSFACLAWNFAVTLLKVSQFLTWQRHAKSSSITHFLSSDKDILADLHEEFFVGHDGPSIQSCGNRERLSSSNSEDLHPSKSMSLAERNKQAQRRHRQRQRVSLP